MWFGDEAMMKGETDTIFDFVSVLAGPTIWFAHFFFVYGAQSVLCTFDRPAAVPWTVLFATVLALGSVAWLVIDGIRRSDRLIPRPDGEHQDFMAYLKYAIAFASGISIVWVGATAAILPPCS
jgi:hypothetical protein